MGQERFCNLDYQSNNNSSDYYHFRHEGFPLFFQSRCSVNLFPIEVHKRQPVPYLKSLAFYIYDECDFRLLILGSIASTIFAYWLIHQQSISGLAFRDQLVMEAFVFRP